MFGLTMLGTINPALGFFAGLLGGLLLGDDGDNDVYALMIESIMRQVRNKMRSADAEKLNAEVGDVAAELQWLPSMLGCDGSGCRTFDANDDQHQTRVSYFL